MALLMGEIVDEHGTPNDFLGHPGSDNFIVITYTDNPDAFKQKLAGRFNEAVQQHYSFIDRERGFMLREGKEVPLMLLSEGSVSNATHQFADIREITELAAEDRRRGDSDDFEPVDTSW
jgi:hypothetical protein